MCDGRKKKAGGFAQVFFIADAGRERERQNESELRFVEMETNEELTYLSTGTTRAAAA